MRLALIAIAYPPDRSSVAVQMRDLARQLRSMGHQPVVLVPDATISHPWQCETLDGIEVVRLRSPKSRDRKYLARTIAEFVMPWAMLRALKKSPLKDERWDGIIWYSPSIFFGPLVRALKRSSTSRSYLILRDIFPEWAVDLGLMRRGVAYRMFKLIERQQHNAADTIGIQAPSNARYLAHLRGRSGLSIEVLWNWLAAAPESGCTIDLSSTALAGRTIFVYAGNMGVAQGLDVFLDLAQSLQSRSNIGFLFVGRGSEVPRLRRIASQRELDNTLFCDEVDPNEIPGLLAQCHVGILALDPRHRTHNIPGKFLTYLQAGLPILAQVNPNNDLVDLMQSERVGRVNVDLSLASLQRLAEEMAADVKGRAEMGMRGRKLAEKLFSPAAAASQILAAISDGGR